MMILITGASSGPLHVSFRMNTSKQLHLKDALSEIAQKNETLELLFFF